MRRRRVKITGIGPVTPAGVGRADFWNGILESVSRVRPFHGLGEQYGELVAAHLAEFAIENYVDRTLVPKGVARHTLFAIAGTALALRDAGITAEELQHRHCAVVIGSSLMDFGGIVGAIDSIAKRGLRGAQTRALYTTGISSVPSAINQFLGIAAHTNALSTQCSAGMDAIGHAADLVATGQSDLVICGGTEAPLHRFPLLEFRAAELTPASSEMPERIARPFDLWRTTGVVSEGAAVLILEPDTSPNQGYSYINGYAFANDLPGKLCDGMTTAGRLAAAEARMKVADIDSINAWGPGHKKIDAAEATAMKDLFGNALPGISVVSIKGSVGSALGAAPAIQIAAAALAQKHEIIPPTVNWEYPDPECPFNLSNRPRSISHRYTLVNSHGLGGVNASLVLERC